MESSNHLTFQFISEPTDINYGGNVHGGVVMKWIDQAAFACASSWSGTYCVTVYVGGIRFYKPIGIGSIVRIESTVLHTGRTSMHIGVDVLAKKATESKFEKKTHCIIVFVSVDENGKPQEVRKWHPRSEHELRMQTYAKRLKELRQEIHEEMRDFMD